MNTNTGNLFESIPKDLSNEIFTELVSAENLKIDRIVSKGHTSPSSGWYDQAENEWVVVLKGEAIITFESTNEIRLTPGNYINIPARKKHKVTWTDPNMVTVWLAIHYK